MYFQKILLTLTEIFMKGYSKNFIIHFIIMKGIQKEVSEERKFILELVIIFIQILLFTSQKT